MLEKKIAKGILKPSGLTKGGCFREKPPHPPSPRDRRKKEAKYGNSEEPNRNRMLFFSLYRGRTLTVFRISPQTEFAP